MMDNGKITLQVKGTPLIKFQSAERIESLRKGKIYAKTLRYYREREQETGDDAVGDMYEAMLHVNEGSVVFNDTGEKIDLNDSLIETKNSHDFVFCMFGIYPELDSFEFSETQKEKMLSFGDTALLVLDSEEFIKRVKCSAEDTGYEFHFDGVKYYDSTEDCGNLIISLMQGMWNISFWKREKYRYQQEARFVFSPGNGEDHIELNIGDISDITAVLPAKQVLTAMVAKNK